jgi:hypothetical protein
MHPRIREITEYLETQRRALRLAVDAVPAAVRARRPTPESWSVAEVLEHVGLVEMSVAGLFGRALGEARMKGLGPEQATGPVVTTLDVAMVADRGRRIEAAESGQPRGGLDAEAAWARLDALRVATLAALHEADGLALAEVAVPHRILGTLDLYQWMVFLGAHEARHAEQIRAIHDALSAAPPDPEA